MSLHDSRLGPFRFRARGLLNDPAQVLRMVNRVLGKLNQTSAREAFGSLRDDALLLLDLLRARARGDYLDVSTTALVSLTAALLYLLAPIDAVPDFIAGLGLLDDAAVLGYVLTSVRDELDAFRAWREQGTAGQDAPSATSNRVSRK